MAALNDLDMEKLQSQYLEIDEKTHLSILKEWVKDFEFETDEAYLMFCQLYRDLLIYADNHQSHSFDPQNSLKKCISKLELLDNEDEASYYEAWLTAAKGDFVKAEMLFRALQISGDLPESFESGIQKGLEYVQGKTWIISSDSHKGLSKYGYNLSALVRENKSQQAFEIENLVSEMVDILAYSSKKSIILIGPTGVGKTAAVRQLAHIINSGKCPKPLKGHTIFQVSTVSIIAGAIYIGQWQERLEELCNLGGNDKKILLYFEDITNIFGAGISSNDKSSFSDFLIPRIEQGKITIIGEMTQEQSRKIFWEEPRFQRLITEVTVDEPTENKLPDILKNASQNIIGRRKVDFKQGCFTEAIELSGAFIPYKAFPGKAIDIISKAVELSKGSSNKGNIQITPDDITLAFCELTGIPDLIVDQKQKILPEKIMSFFNERVLGQEDAMGSIIEAVISFKARLCDENKPIRSFLFVGPTGVGKTESSKVLADYLFGSPSRIIRLNMSEYNERDAVSKLIGSHYEDAKKCSRFIEEIRDNPFSVVLFDEIEKAHHDIHNLLLQLLDEGILLDGEGKPAYFKSCIIIMTSNIGAMNYSSQKIGFGSDTKVDLTELNKAVLKEVRGFFSPEIYNRFDGVICFRPLSKDVLSIIINREIGKVLERKGIKTGKFSIDIDPTVKDYIIEIGYDPKYGARHIKRAVEKAIAVPLASLLVSEELPDDCQIRINMRRNKPVAELLHLIEEKPVTDLEMKELSSSDIKVPDRGLKKIAASLEGRIHLLKSKLDYDNTLSQKENLQNQMLRPSFWDNPKEANQVLARYAEHNQKVERMNKWISTYDRITSILKIPEKKRSRQEIGRLKAQVVGLIKDLESAEMELLLEGEHDSADTFMILQAEDSSKSTIKWLLELLGVYINWSRRRGYRYKIIGEQPGNRQSGKCSIILHISGMNAFGLLKNECGIHRKAQGKRAVKKNIDCLIFVMPDIYIHDVLSSDLNLRIKKMTKPVTGNKMKKLSQEINVKGKRMSLDLNFYSDTTFERDKHLPLELFLSYQNFCEKKNAQKRDGEDNPWGSLIRTYERSDKSRVVDFKSKLVIKNVKDYLGGKIDSLLIERLI
ncbi:MAG: AAA family ATPase [Candidatus Zixiibacteriota bacterium]